MDPMKLTTIARVTGGRLFSGTNPVATGAVIDSREVRQGDLFVAIPGEKADGRNFLEDAFERGAAAALVERRPGDITRSFPGPVILVDDVVKAFGELASFHRDRLHGTVIAITGSVGKTSTKDMIACAVEGSRSFIKAPRSYNNHLGVPLTLLSASSDTEVVIVEVGTNGPGEIDTLGAIVRPDVAVITAVGYSHLCGLGSIEGVQREKSALLKHVRPGGFAVFNGDDIRVRAMASAFRAVHGEDKALTVGIMGTDNDWVGTPVELLDATPGSSSRMLIQGAPAIELNVPGLPALRTALIAFAVAAELGVRATHIVDRFASFQPSPGRMEIHRTERYAIIDDAYNSNPTSLRASLESFTLFAADRTRVAILGDMAELGSFSESLHRHMGRAVSRLGLDKLITVGPEAAYIAEEAVRRGMPAESVTAFQSVESLLSQPVAEVIEPGAAVLVKGSRVVGLEAVARNLLHSAMDTATVFQNVA